MSVWSTFSGYCWDKQKSLNEVRWAVLGKCVVTGDYDVKSHDLPTSVLLFLLFSIIIKS